MVPFFILFGSQHFAAKFDYFVKLKNHSKWFHFSFFLVLNILLQNLCKILCQIYVKLKNHSKWFHFSFFLVLNILLQNLTISCQFKKSFKMVPFFILFGSQHSVAKFDYFMSS